MILALFKKFPFILYRNLAKANCTEDHVCTSCDTVVLGRVLKCVWALYDNTTCCALPALHRCHMSLGESAPCVRIRSEGPTRRQMNRLPSLGNEGSNRKHTLFGCHLRWVALRSFVNRDI